jgi:hypothetical protein
VHVLVSRAIKLKLAIVLVSTAFGMGYARRRVSDNHASPTSAQVTGGTLTCNTGMARLTELGEEVLAASTHAVKLETVVVLIVVRLLASSSVVNSRCAYKPDPCIS